MVKRIRVAILEDHQGIVDGYVYRLSPAPEIEIAACVYYGEDLEETLRNHMVNVLLLDLFVPSSPENPQPFPVLHTVPALLEKFPDLHILVISMLTEPALVQALVEAGISGYIFKHDQRSIQQLRKVVNVIANGGIYFSEDAYQGLRKDISPHPSSLLTARQLEALSLCSAYPDCSTAQLASRLSVSHSTFRNLLSSAYLRLGVRTRAAAILKSKELGLIASQPA